MLSVVTAICNTFKQLSRHNTEDLCFCARRAMLSAVVFTNGRQKMAYALRKNYYSEWFLPRDAMHPRY